MADEWEENENLPNLPDETSSEELVLQQKVFRYNEAFKTSHNEIIDWLCSPEENHKYPKQAKNNKYSFQKRACKYTFNEKNGKLYRKVISPDGIGKSYHNLKDAVKIVRCFQMVHMLIFSYIVLFILEHHVEVIFSLDWQNELIKSSHYRVVDTLQSKASHGHYGRDKIIILLQSQILHSFVERERLL